MIDLEFLRSNPDAVKRAVTVRNLTIDVDALLAEEQEYRTLLQEVERLRADRNEKNARAAKDHALRPTLKALKEALSAKEMTLAERKKSLETAIAELPNIPREDVPVGKDESGNVVVRVVGKKPQLQDPKDYLSLGESLGIIDTKRASKVSGSRFGYLVGAMAQLEFALVQYAQKLLLKEGFILVVPPVMIKSENMAAMGYLAGGGERETYHFAEDDLYLVGTSEQSIGPMHRDETFEAKELPRRYLAFSTCFRREAGSYGKDTKGILRVHQFDKLEMFSFTTPDASDAEHGFLLAMEEKLVQGLGLHYRVVNLCTGDLGYPSARTYDIEMWLPSEDRFRETHSTSTTTDFQARALNVKVLQNGKKTFVHMLNGTAFTNRTTIALLEQYQQADGSIAIPNVLHPFMNGLKKIAKNK